MAMRPLASLTALLLATSPALAAAQTQVWSTPTRTEQVDTASMKRAAPVRNPGPIELRIVGAWDVWIPGAVTYHTDGRAVYQRYEPGAAMNRLQITADGSYQWGDRKGRLEEVKPWHAQEGRRYYRVTNSLDSEYEFYHADGDRLVVLFGGVGGHAATGTRLAGSPGGTQAAPRGGSAGARQPTPPSPTSPDRPTAPTTSPTPPSGNPLGVEWRTGASGSGTATAASGSTATTNPSTSGNALDIEWRTGSTASGSTTKPTESNPLGVEWRTGSQQTGATGGATSDPRPAPEGPKDPAPTGGKGGAPTAATLADRWSYIAVAFTGNGTTVSETRGVSGSLVLKPDGSYEQSLTIGGIVNAVKGSWRVDGDRLVTFYTWGGRAASDIYTVQLSDDGDRLTLALQGATKGFYTLDRVK